MQLFISGDFCPINRLENLMSDENIEYVFGFMLNKIRISDLAITNLECPLTESTKARNKTGPNLKGSLKSSRFLKSAGFNLVTLANNHIMDYGTQGLKDTIKVLKKDKINYVGAGLSLNQAKSIFYYKKNNINVAIINFTENEWSTTTGDYSGSNPINPVQNFYLINEAKKNADKVIVITHGGHEMYDLPSPRMKKLFRFFVDVGADVVINHHTHCISGYEIYKKAPIFYSLGNFIFDNQDIRDNLWNIGMAVNLIFDKSQIKFETLYYQQCNNKPIITEIKDVNKIKEKINYLNSIIQNDDELEKSFDLFINNKKNLYNSYIEPHKNKYLYALQNRGFLPSFWSKRKRNYLLNLVRCESHREILIKILQNENSNTQ